MRSASVLLFNCFFIFANTEVVNDIILRIHDLEEKQRQTESAFRERIQTLKKELACERQRNVQIQDHLEEQSKQNNEFQKRLKAEIRRGDSLEQQLRLAEDVAVSLESCMNKLDGTKFGSSDDTVAHNDTLQFVREVAQSRKSITRRQASLPAFTVYLNSHATLGQDQPIPFDQVITNEGNGYNVYTNAFSCTRAGMYLLMFFIGDDKAGVDMQAYLEINSVNQVDAALRPYANGFELQGGNAVLARLNVGDVVMVKGSANNVVMGSSNLRTTTFSGIFLYP